MVLSVVKKWGNSYGIVLPISAVRENKLSENDTIDIEICRKVRNIQELFGTCKYLKGDAQKIKDEMRAGWND
jgi:antitoxin component of MazEF toxin-antitoxin module